MPLLSVCIPAYNSGAHISCCLESVLSQDMGDVEVVVANDGSTDGTGAILEEFSSQDKRVRVVELARNSGTHCARKAAALASSGEYVLFLDSDDALVPYSLGVLLAAVQRSRADYFHFGLEVRGGESVDDSVASGMQSQANAPLAISCMGDVYRYAYEPCGGYVMDWRLTQRVYAGQAVRAAFASMSDERMCYGEDAYEHFVLCDFVSHPVVDNAIVAYRYNLGAGTSDSLELTHGKFLAMAESFGRVANGAECFAEGRADTRGSAAAAGLRRKASELLINDWRERTGHDISLLDRAAECLGARAIAAEVFRIVRDDAYADWDHGVCISDEEPYLAWFDYAKGLVENEADLDEYCLEMREAAGNHIADLRQRSAFLAEAGAEVPVPTATSALGKLRGLLARLRP